MQHQGVHFAQVSLSEIEERTEVFQHREGLQEYHVKELATLLKQGKTLDPVSLWHDPDTDRLVLVDGHHRIAAYRKAGRTDPIPAEVHHCDRKAARLLAMAENGKARLPFNKAERMNAAWALVCDGPVYEWTYSKAEIRQTTGTSDGTIATMRKTRKDLLADDPEADIDPSWNKVFSQIKNGNPRDFTDAQREAMIAAKTAELDSKVGKALGFYAQNQREAAIAVIMDRCDKACRQELYEELMWEFDRDRVEAEADY